MSVDTCRALVQYHYRKKMARKPHTASRGLTCPTIPARPSRAQNCALAGMNAASSRPRPVPPRPPDEACAAAAPQKAWAELVT